LRATTVTEIVIFTGLKRAGWFSDDRDRVSHTGLDCQATATRPDGQVSRTPMVAVQFSDPANLMEPVNGATIVR